MIGWGAPFMPSCLVPEGACDLRGCPLVVPECEPEEYAAFDFAHAEAIEDELNSANTGRPVLVTDHIWNVPDREYRERYWAEWARLVEASGLPSSYGRRLPGRMARWRAPTRPPSIAPSWTPPRSSATSGRCSPGSTASPSARSPRDA